MVDERDLPVVLLRETGGARLLPIWIGTAEATAIARHIHDAPAPRPDTHDLAQQLIEQLEGRVERVVVSDLRGGTYYGVLYLRASGSVSEVDVRPSDGIALAVRVGAPIFVRESVLDAAGNEAEEAPQPEADESDREPNPAGNFGPQHLILVGKSVSAHALPVTENLRFRRGAR